MYIAILVIECLCIWFLFVETMGPTLEEIARLFDGNQANVAGKEIFEERRQQATQTTKLYMPNACKFPIPSAVVAGRWLSHTSHAVRWCQQLQKWILDIE